MRKITKAKNSIDWVLVSLLGVVSLWGLSVLYSSSYDSLGLFDKQIMLISIACITMLGLSFFDFRFLRLSWVVMSIYIAIVGVLASLVVFGSVFSGAQSWFSVGSFAIQPAEFAKVALILVLAKYFSKRHVEIASIKHIIVSGLYALVLFVLVARQPDFGSALILFCIWFGMVLLAGLNWKHLFILIGGGILALGMMWLFMFSPYQKQRIITFINPEADLRGSGYNSAQATIAVGSGGITGRGIGNGSQSRLQFLPQYQTDFIVAAFAEEWGFIGMLFLLLIYVAIVSRIILSGMHGETNFEMLFAGGVAIYFGSHIIIHTGINVGLLPVTGITIPFMSYGGSHLLAEAIAVGIVFGMRKHRRTTHRQSSQTELYSHT